MGIPGSGVATLDTALWSERGPKEVVAQLARPAQRQLSHAGMVPKKSEATGGSSQESINFSGYTIDPKNTESKFFGMQGWVATYPMVCVATDCWTISKWYIPKELVTGLLTVFSSNGNHPTCQLQRRTIHGSHCGQSHLWQGNRPNSDVLGWFYDLFWNGYIMNWPITQWLIMNWHSWLYNGQ